MKKNIRPRNTITTQLAKETFTTIYTNTFKKMVIKKILEEKRGILASYGIMPAEDETNRHFNAKEKYIILEIVEATIKESLSTIVEMVTQKRASIHIMHFGTFSPFIVKNKENGKILNIKIRFNPARERNKKR